MPNLSSTNTRLPKGTTDLYSTPLTNRNHLISLIRTIYSSSGATELETPTFELTSTLTKNTDSDTSKQIFNIEDLGTDCLSLRYDLTVPFCRFLSTNSIKKMKRFSIGKVYRRDNPSVALGRMREFLQCDFDIIGEMFSKKEVDMECLIMANRVLTRLNVGEFKIIFNSRLFLDFIVVYCLDGEFEGDRCYLNRICSSIDKLDKGSFEDIEEELGNKGMSVGSIDNLKTFFSKKDYCLNDIKEIITNFKAKDGISKSSYIVDLISKVEEEIKDFEFYFKTMEELNIRSNFVLDFSLARGLDYYTGVIFEAKSIDRKVGSIAGGGRYDNLIYSMTGNKIPAVGFSIGIERIICLLERNWKKNNKIKELSLGEERVKVLIVSIKIEYGDACRVREKILDYNESEKLVVEICLDNNKNVKKQIDRGVKGFDVIVGVGSEELETGCGKVKFVNDKSEDMVKFEDIAGVIKQRFFNSK